MLSLLEHPEPNWDESPIKITIPTEMRFDTDEYLRTEIKRVLADCDLRVISLQYSSKII